MRDYDFSPLWRSSIGFDRLFDLINTTQGLDRQDGYPPYDIVRTGPEAYRITLALAGFSPNDINITAVQNQLTVAGRTETADKGTREFLYQGISSRPFERHFSLEDHVEVQSANFENGLLEIDLVRRVPEAAKPRKIDIGSGQSSNGKGKPKPGRTA